MHPSLPYLLSSSDDMLIKLWDWDKVRQALATSTELSHVWMSDQQPLSHLQCCHVLLVRAAHMIHLDPAYCTDDECAV